jgi:GNAT superfamily N-acetyltransferase
VDIDVRAVDPYDEGAMADRHTVSAAAHAHDVSDFPPLCPVRYAGRLRLPGKAEANLSWVAYVGGQPAGVLDLSLPLLDNPGNAQIDLRVVPGYRRRGVGRMLYAFAIEAARRHGRVRLFSDTVCALPGGVPRDPAGSAFARAMGATEALREVRRRLELSGAPLPEVPEAPWYSVLCWCDLAPEEYLADLARLDSRLMADAPRGEMVFEVPDADPERTRDDQQVRLARRERLYDAVVRHDATGTLVAWTRLAFEPTVPDHAWQLMTVVDPAHRGRRLGLRVKVANLRYTVPREPALRVIDTWNAASNTHMIAINEALGFRPVDGWNQWQHEFG